MAMESALAPKVRNFAITRTSPAIRIRRATIRDVDVMVNIALEAMPMDPQWNWRFPYWREFPEDIRFFTRRKYEEFLHDQGSWMIMLAECDDVERPIAMAIWEVSALGHPEVHNCS